MTNNRIALVKRQRDIEYKANADIYKHQEGSASFRSPENLNIQILDNSVLEYLRDLKSHSEDESVLST